MKTKSLSIRRILSVASALFLLLHQKGFGALPVIDTATFSGHIYYLLDTSNWTDAENQAVQLGGHLTTINNQGENDFLWNKWGSNHTLWIGLNDVAVEGTFVWANGEAVNYTHWNAGEPNNGVGYGQTPENYTYIYAAGWAPNGSWNDSQNVTGLAPQPNPYGVVELVPEPSSACLLGSALLFGVMRRKLARA
jgi:hypothetical protein